MKVLLVHSNFLPYVRAGSEIYTFYLAEELQNNGIEVEVLFARKGTESYVERACFEEISCTILNRPLDNNEGLFHEEDAWTDEMFSNCLRRFQPDIVHVNHLFRLSVNIPKIAKAQNKPVVFTLHDYWLRCARFTLLDSREQRCESAGPMKCALCCRELYTKYPLYRNHGKRNPLNSLKSFVKLALWSMMELPFAHGRMKSRDSAMREMMNFVDAWISPSQFLLERMVEWGLPREKVMFLRYGFKGSVFNRYGARSERRGRLQFAYVGTLSRHKGVHLLLEAFRGIKNADLHIYGDFRNQFFADYESVVSQANVFVRGVLEDEEKGGAFEQMDALIVPSIWVENSPLTIQEAFLAGVPVICSGIGGMKELVREGRDGFHFVTNSAKDLRSLIQGLVEDPYRLRKLTPSTSDVVRIEDHVKAKIIPLYRNLLHKDSDSSSLL
jgi:Glycosyltransferase